MMFLYNISFLGGANHIGLTSGLGLFLLYFCPVWRVNHNGLARF